MFVFDPNPTFTHPEKVKVPVDGGFVDQTFRAAFNVVPTEDAKNYDLDDGDGSTAFLRRAVTHMHDLIGLDDQPVTYNDKLRDVLLSQIYVRKALARTYFDAMAGVQSAS